MSYVQGACSGGGTGTTYDVLYSSNSFTTGSIASAINNVAKQYLLNPAVLAAITSMETESAGLSSNCSGCGSNSYVGVTQIGEAMFNDYNSANGNKLTWCSGICGSSGYIDNLTICAQYLYSALGEIWYNLGVTNSIQAMAMAATSWDGCTCHGAVASIQPWNTGIYSIPGTSDITEYGSSAGYIFKNSGHVGTGVWDTSVTL